MKIEVLNIDGMGRAAEAWRLSRDVDKRIEWEDIYTVDGPVNEFPNAVCHFKDFTILEREIFASNRGHVMWARTSFVDAPDKYRVPKDLLPVCDPLVHASLKGMMEKGKNAGEHQDRWRRYLPVSAETCFSYRISYRDAIKMAKYFVYLADLVAPCLKERFMTIAEELFRLIDLFTGSRDKTMKAGFTMRLAKFLNEEAIHQEQPQHFSGITVATFEVPFWIRAHFIRHRPITVADDLFDFLKINNVLDLTINHPVVMQVAATENIWNQLLGSRACWLTQSTLGAEYDPWATIVDQFGGAVLPCAGGTCPHHRDARNRLEGSDPGVPCPRYIHLNQLDVAPHRQRIEMALKSRPKLWEQEYAKANGQLIEEKIA